MADPTVSQWVIDVKDLVRGLVRPLTTLGFIGIFAGAFFQGDIADLPQWLYVVGVATITWWFAERPIAKVVEALNGSK